jgi:hypothetical protein
VEAKQGRKNESQMGKLLRHFFFEKTVRDNIHSKAIADEKTEEEKERKNNDFWGKISGMLPYHIFITEYFYQILGIHGGLSRAAAAYQIVAISLTLCSPEKSNLIAKV